jgi:hypothetical protein
VGERVGCINSVATPDVLICRRNRVCAPHALQADHVAAAPQHPRLTACLRKSRASAPESDGSDAIRAVFRREVDYAWGLHPKLHTLWGALTRFRLANS